MGSDEPFSRRRILLVAAHPDDEVIGAGGQLAAWADRLDIVHVTNGSPPDPLDAHRAGCATGEEYAAMRRAELLSALSLAGIPPVRCHEIGVGDQRSAFALSHIVEELRTQIERLRPGLILTHPYEGGHPDHDSTAFAVHAAAADTCAEMWEFTSYHAGPNGGIETGRFLDRGEAQPHIQYALNREQAERKREMFSRFRTQQQVLADFRADIETFRRAPHYDFTEPPHPGRLYYEQFDWGVTGSQWRELARAAFHQLEAATHATNYS
jgi:LmbE family N-acetylglucosaminyl deacetylase